MKELERRNRERNLKVTFEVGNLVFYKNWAKENWGLNLKDQSRLQRRKRR
eukprot:GAHX01002989.1.p2 GENE.GAHX01002989.1~~GAHX01002989.1.p2  ORF type:complete len:50 (+),score=7.54 GAHX01002989.1:158-307(+)